MLLDVDPEAFTTAAAGIAETARAVAAARHELVDTLRATCGMAGSDPVGASWAVEYDAAARHALRALSALEDACRRVAVGLDVTGLNYATAEHLNCGGSGVAPGCSVPALPPEVHAAPPPSASGGVRTSPIPGFELVANAIGRRWPDGDTELLRAAADAWHRLGTDLDGLPVRTTLAPLDDAKTPELPTIRERVGAIAEAASTLAGEARALGRAGARFADEIDRVHGDTRRVLHDLRIHLEATAAVGLGLTVLTAGVSDAGAGLAAGGEVGIAVGRILGLIDSATPAISSTVDEIAATVAPLARAVGLSDRVTVRVVTISGHSVTSGVGGAVADVGITAITDPHGDLEAAAVRGFVGGAALGLVSAGGGAALAAVDRYRFWHGPDAPVTIAGTSRTIPRQLFDDSYATGTHQMTSASGMLGKYIRDSPDSYIARAGTDHAYFDMGQNWNATKTFLHLSDDDMFAAYNTRFLDELIADGRPFHFSHDPRKYAGSALDSELTYLESRGYVFDPLTMRAVFVGPRKAH